MKKLLIILALIYLGNPHDLPAQSIEYKQTGITITADAIDAINNQIRYLIVCPFDKALLLSDMFPGKNFVSDGNQLIYGGIISVPNLHEIEKSNQILSSDVGKTVESGQNTFAVNIIFGYNLLKIVQNDWNLK